MLCVTPCLQRSYGQRYRNCGGILNATRGVISTPNFPREFPTPIECRWLIKAEPGKKIIVYFTQYYLRGGLYASEYDLYMYSDETLYVGRNYLGELEELGETSIVSLTAYKPYLLLRMDINEMDNMNIRVDEYIMDVYGFNITYEVTDVTEPVKQNSCTVAECSFLGNCLVTSDYRKFYCDCFTDFYGDHCQYGQFCNPKHEIWCRNGGKCQ